MNERGRIVGIGVAVLDAIWTLPYMPKENEKITTSVPPITSMGGTTPIKLWQLKNFGWDTSFIAAIGNDAKGSQLQAAMETAGIDNTGLDIQTDHISACASVWLNKSNGTRTVAFSKGTLTPVQATDTQIDALLDGAAAVVTDAHEPELTKRIAVQCEQKNIPLVLDAGTVKPYAEELLRISKIVQAPRRFIEEFCGTSDLLEGAKKICSYGPTIAVVTDGQNGAAFFSETESGFVPAFVVKTVDSLGAGDIFGGGLVHAFLSGRSLNDSVRFGAAAAAWKCKQFGKEPFPSESELDVFIGENHVS